jgi:regulator of sigma E protease
MLIWMLVAFVFILGPVMFLHELGHFWAAKRNGIPVEEFGFGIGPKVLTLFRRGGTEYTIRAVPFAAFVRLAGEQEAGIRGGLMDAPRRSKLAVFLAGPGMNIAATLVLLWIGYLFGPPGFTRVAVAEVDPNSPAEMAGLQPDDIILKADNVEIETTDDLATYTSEHLGVPIVLTIERDGAVKELQVIPRTEGEYDPEVEGPMGILMHVRTGPPAPENPFKAVVSAAKDFGGQVEMIINFPKMVIHAARVSAEKGGTGEVLLPQDDIRNFRPVGIIGILQLMGLTLQTGVTQGYVFYIFQTAALISMALGVTNLLPVPGLDGGHLFFVTLDWLSEKILNRRISPEKEIIFHAVGLMVLLLLMVLITWQDIINPLIEFPTPTP